MSPQVSNGFSLLNILGEQKEVAMETNALKKQLGAAIAMVLVAAVALGSATYAWFVTNSEVKATTSTISAQSNAAFMTIANDTTGAKSSDATEATTTVNTKALYPATYGEQDVQYKGTWMTGYGTALGDSTLKSGTLKKVTADNEADGSTAAAVASDYALQQDYNISAKANQKLTDLKVKEVTAFTGSGDGSSLKSALRILVTSDDGNAWAVYGLNADGNGYEVKLSSAANTSTDVVYADEISSSVDTPVHVYLYYEGSNTNVTTANLVDGKLSETNKVTVTFSATPDNK